MSIETFLGQNRNFGSPSFDSAQKVDVFGPSFRLPEKVSIENPNFPNFKTAEVTDSDCQYSIIPKTIDKFPIKFRTPFESSGNFQIGNSKLNFLSSGKLSIDTSEYPLYGQDLDGKSEKGR